MTDPKPESESIVRQEKTAGNDSRPARRRKLLLWLAVGFVFLVPVVSGLLWFYFLPTRTGTKQALVLVNQRLSVASNLRLVSDSVAPTWDGIVLSDVRIEAERNGKWHPLLRSPEIRFGVSLLDLALSRPQVFTVDAREPILTLYHDAEGDAVLPTVRGGSNDNEKPGTLGNESAVGIRIRLEDAEFRVVKEDGILVWWKDGRLRLEASSTSNGYDLEILEGRGFLPQLGLVVTELRGEGTVSEDGYAVENLSIETDAGSIEGSGQLFDQELRAELFAQRWPWEFFAEILEQPAVDVEGDVEIRARFSGPLKAPVVVTELEGMWRQEAFHAHLRAVLEDPAVRLTDARLEWGTAIIEGEGELRFDGRWELDATVNGLDLAQLERLTPRISLPRSDLRGPMRLRGNQGRIHVFHENLSGSFAGIPLAGVSGQWSLAGGRADWTGSGTVAGGSIQGSGTWDGEQLALRAAGEGIRLADLRALDPALSGFTSGEGRFSLDATGPGGALQVRGRCELRETSWKQFGAEMLELGFAGRMGAGPDSLQLVLDGRGFDAAIMSFDSVAARGRWRDGELRVPSFHLARSDTSLSATFTARPLRRGWSVEASPLRLRAGKAILLSDRPALVEFIDGGIHFRSLDLRGNAGRCQLEGWLRGESSDLSLATQDLDLELVFGAFLGTHIAGRVDVDAHVNSDPDAFRLIVEAAAPVFQYAGATVESLVTTLVVGRDGREVDVERLEVHSRSGNLTAAGGGTLPADQDLRQARWWKPLARLHAWRGRVQADDLDLTILGALIPGERELAGMVSATVDLQGPAGERSGKATGRIRGFGLDGYRLDEIAWDARYENGRLRISELSATIGNDVVRAGGTLPLRLAWGEAADGWFPDQPMDLRLELPEGTLRHLPLFLSQIAAAEGAVTADIRLGGTPRRPELYGSLEIRDGGIRFTGREEIYRKLGASVELAGERVVIRDIEARQGSDGRIEGSGEYWLFGENAGRYRLELTADNALAQASGEYAISFDGDFVITDGPRLPGVIIAIPHVRGEVQVRTGVILYDFSDPDNVVYLTGPRQAPMYIFDLEVEARRRVYWRTPSANIELAADLNMSRSLEDLKMWGTVTSLRGTYFFLENKFTVENAELIFDQAESMNPKISAAAVTRVTRALGQKNYEKEEIHIELTGRVQKPEMQLWSSSGLGQTEIVSLLTVGRFGIGEGDYTSGDQRLLVGVTGTQYLVRQLSREFPEISPLLADIEVGTRVGSGERIYTTVGLSRYFTPDLLLRYSQVVGGTASGGSTVDELDLWDVSAEYRIGRLFFLTGEIIERRVTSSVGSGTAEHLVQYNLDVRARLEY